MARTVLLVALMVIAVGCTHNFSPTTEEGRRCLYQCDAWYNACQSGCYGPDAMANISCMSHCAETWNSCGNSCPGVVDTTVAAAQYRATAARRAEAERLAAAQQRKAAKAREKQARADAAARASSASESTIKDKSGRVLVGSSTPGRDPTAADRLAYLSSLAEHTSLGDFSFSVEGDLVDTLVISPVSTDYSRDEAEELASGAREELRALGFKSLVFAWPSGESVLFNLSP